MRFCTWLVGFAMVPSRAPFHIAGCMSGGTATENALCREVHGQLAATFSFNLVESFPSLETVLLEVTLCQNISPLMQSLTNDRTDALIVECRVILHDPGDELSSEPPFWPGEITPSFDLSLIIFASASREEPAIPLHPSIRIECVYPTL